MLRRYSRLLATSLAIVVVSTVVLWTNTNSLSIRRFARWNYGLIGDITTPLRNLNGSFRIIGQSDRLNGSNTTVTVTRNSTVLKPKTKKKPGVQCPLGRLPVDKFKIYHEKVLPDVTVTTAYFNLGRFRKGSASFHTGLYMQWAQVYQYLRNPFVFYTDTQEIADKFTKMREGFENTTKILIIQRKDVWSFKWLDRIKKIYSTKGYPKHYPNTVVPEYSCVQHAKYDLLGESVKNNYFNTTYHTWIDIGYYRMIVRRKKRFVIVKPPNFNESRVAMNKVYSVKMDNSPDTIFKRNVVRIGGGICFGSKFTLPSFIADYRIAVERYLNMSLSNTDQQVIHAMTSISEKKILNQQIEIQEYVSNITGNCWFFLGYACYMELQ